ncbi:glycosyltransferase family 2 protein [Candidatus Omnitrophota bacterium]
MVPDIEKRTQPIFLSIIFSFRNEEEVLPELIKRTREVLGKEKERGHITSHELIFVNDDSTDTSLDILLDHSKDVDDIRIITMSRCFGISECVLAGMQYSSGDAIVYMDADLQDPPEIIHELLDEFFNDQEVTIVHTRRRTRRGESKIKLFLTGIAYTILNRITQVQLPKEAGDFKLLSRRAVVHLLKFREKRPYLRGLIYWMGFKQRFVEYDREARFAGTTKFPVLSLKVISNFTDSALISFSSVPLKLASVFGLVAIGIDLILMCHALFQKLSGNAIPGWTAIMVVTLFLGGVQLFCLGIIGLYLNAIIEQERDRPRYIISKTFGFPAQPSKQELNNP